MDGIPSPLRRRMLAAAAAAAASFALAPRARAIGSASKSESKSASEPRSAAPTTLPLRERPFGNRRVPAIGLGTWRGFDVQPGSAAWDQARATLQRFHALGGRLVDSSPMYGTAEAAVGTLSTELDISAELVLASKIWTDGAAEGRAQLARSLERMQRRRIELMQVHNLVDLDTQMGVLRDAQAAGRVERVGITHYTSGAHADMVRAIEDHAPDAVQINYSVVEQGAAQRVLPAARERGIPVLVNRPFAEGRLLGLLRGAPLPAFADELGARTWAQLLLKWILADEAVGMVLTGTRNPRHIADNLQAATGALPDTAQRQAIAAAVRTVTG